MLSHLDRIIFPERCEVIEVIPSQKYVYSIFKNGSTSLRMGTKKNNWKIKINEQLAQLTNIDVILRDPEERFISGVNTFVQMTIRDNPTLDFETVLWFAKNYLFLNRHYCLQFHWLLHLSKYINKNTNLHFIGLDGLSSVTELCYPPPDVSPTPPEIRNQLINLKNNEMYQRIDTAIFDCIGQVMTFDQLLQHIKSADADAYEYVIGYVQQLLKPIYAVP